MGHVVVAYRNRDVFKALFCLHWGNVNVLMEQNVFNS